MLLIRRLILVGLELYRLIRLFYRGEVGVLGGIGKRIFKVISVRDRVGIRI